MRTTLTLDEDVAAKLKAISRRSGRAFREVVNETLRQGLVKAPSGPSAKPFKIRARDLGPLAAGLSLDNISELLDRVEGPRHR